MYGDINKWISLGSNWIRKSLRILNDLLSHVLYNRKRNHHILDDSSHRPCIISRPGRCKITTNKNKDMKWYAVRSCGSFISPYPWNRSIDADRSLASLTTRWARHQWEGTKVKERIKRYCCSFDKKESKDMTYPKKNAKILKKHTSCKSCLLTAYHALYMIKGEKSPDSSGFEILNQVPGGRSWWVLPETSTAIRHEQAQAPHTEKQMQRALSPGTAPSKWQ